MPKPTRGDPLTSLRPYLIRAVIDWIVDNGHTPHMVIDCGVPNVDAPAEYANGGKLTLNISASAVGSFAVDNAGVRLDCRFRGQSRHIAAPVGAVVGVYAKETGMGMGFGVDRGDPNAAPAAKPSPGSRPTLKLVK